MKHSDFVHLHNHSDYSLLDGASSIQGMVRRAAELKMPALALTDHGVMFGAIEFYNEARKAGIKPIVGMEAYVTRGARTDRSREDKAHHLVLLASDEVGFHNLMRLSSLAYLEGFYYKPRVDHEILSRFSQGILALSACPQGEIAADLLEDRDEAALATAMLYRDIFGPENYFLEIQNHGLDIETKIRAKVEQLARKTGLPLVATNDCHYIGKDHTEAQDVLICIQTGKTVSEAQRMRALAELHFRSPEEMRLAFPDHPEAIANTLAVAERCNLQLQLGKFLLPEFPLPEGWASAEEYFRDLAWRELKERFRGQVSDEMKTRFAYELDVICKMGFASYFLIVRDFIAFAKSNGIGVGPGRGSVAGSLVAFALRITDVDPLKHGLIFERFLNPERVTMPDIDIDFDDLRRGEVIDYVKRKYGETNVTQIITFGTMGAKGVVRDVGRALGLPVSEVNSIAKMVPDGLGMTLEKALEESPDLKALASKGADYAKLLKTARVLEGLARHASTHAAGVLITPGPLLDYVPLYRQKDGSTTTQWDMQSVEKAGLLKMDFLGLRTLSVLAEGLRLVEKHHGATIDWQALEFDDPAVYKLFQDGDTVAIFQFESPGMRDYLKKLKPTVFEDLVAMNALYRPGPMENIPYFVDCKHGVKIAKFDHAKLEPILKATYGVFVYQEQVMGAAHDLAGFSMAQADELRRAMGKKNVEEMQKKRAQFIEGCAKSSKITEKVADKIFTTMEKFAGYGFNKCALENTRLTSPVSGEETTIGELFRSRRPFHVHALNDDWKLVPRAVTDVVWNGVKPVFELTTLLGHRITVTANHPFRTLEGWTDLADLKPGDLIAAPRIMKVDTTESWPAYEIITLAGVLAEGNTCHSSTLYFYGNDRMLVEDFRDAVQQFPDTVARIHERGDGRLEVAANLGAGYAREGDDPDYGMASVHGNLALVQEALPRRCGAFQWAQRLDLTGKKATEKIIPPDVFRLCDADLRLFLGRLWAGDGFIANQALAMPYHATSSEELARGVQRLLLRLSMVSGIQTKRFRYRGGIRIGYTVRLIGTDSVERFEREIVPHVLGRDRAIAFLREHLASTRRGMTSRDVVPLRVREWVDEDRLELGFGWEELESDCGVRRKDFTAKRPGNRHGYRRTTIGRVARKIGSLRLERLATSDVFWDRVISITPMGEQDTYDLTVEKDHNFVADGLIVHNSHSAAYALVAYQCAYLKAHYPAEFMAATMTSELSDTARIFTLIEEARRMGIAVRPPDVNTSDLRFSIEDGAIRIGLAAIRNVGEGAVEALIAARETGGAFHDLYDLAGRVAAGVFNRRVLESLICAGACDALGPRAAMFAAAGMALDHAASVQRERDSGQSSLFGGTEDAGLTSAAPPLPQVPDWTGRERAAKEKEGLGFYLSDHPLMHIRDEVAAVATHTLADALESEDGTEVRIVGIVSEKKQIMTKSGKFMGKLHLEDLSGRAECTLFSDAWEAAKPLLEADAIVIGIGKVEKRGDFGPQILLNEVRAWERGAAAFRPILQIEMRAEELTEDRLRHIDEVLSLYPGDSDVYLHIVRPDHSRLAMRSKRCRVAQAEGLIEGLKQRVPGCRVRWGKGGA